MHQHLKQRAEKAKQKAFAEIDQVHVEFLLYYPHECKRCPETFSLKSQLHRYITAHHTKKPTETSPSAVPAPLSLPNAPKSPPSPPASPNVAPATTSAPEKTSAAAHSIGNTSPVPSSPPTTPKSTSSPPTSPISAPQTAPGPETTPSLANPIENAPPSPPQTPTPSHHRAISTPAPSTTAKPPIKTTVQHERSQHIYLPPHKRAYMTIRSSYFPPGSQYPVEPMTQPSNNKLQLLWAPNASEASPVRDLQQSPVLREESPAPVEPPADLATPSTPPIHDKRNLDQAHQFYCDSFEQKLLKLQQYQEKWQHYAEGLEQRTKELRLEVEDSHKAHTKELDSIHQAHKQYTDGLIQSRQEELYECKQSHSKAMNKLWSSAQEQYHKVYTKELDQVHKIHKEYT
ncbi:MAG: hypothetical protein Q9221_003745 [Calogaya cf. arnoldii]